MTLNFQKRNWRKYKEVVFRELPNLELSAFPKSLHNSFTDILKIAAEEAIPKKVFRPNNVPWMNGELKSLI